MESARTKAANALRIVLGVKGHTDELSSATDRLLAAVRRGESDMALRQQVGNVQNRLAGRVSDQDCRQAVELLKKVAANA